MPSLGPNEGAYAGISTGLEPVAEANANTGTSATVVKGNTPGSTVPPMGGAENTQTRNINPAANIVATLENKTTVGNIAIPTPIDVFKLELSLVEHPDPNFVAQLCTNLRCGAHIGFEGERAPRFSKNLPTALAQPDIISSNLAHETSLGRVAGPFDNPPFPNFQVSPIGLVPKKHSAKFRTIFHLSFPKSGTASINASISKDDFSLQYVTIYNAIEGIKCLGQGCFLAKTDIEAAFRLIPVHPDDYELLGMHWNGKYYYDKVLPFGLRSAPFIFNQLSDAIEWILSNKCHISFVCHILDDFLIMEPASPGPQKAVACQASLNAMSLTFRNLNIHIAPGKTEGPSTVFEFMGIILDSTRMEARLPPSC